VSAVKLVGVKVRASDMEGRVQPDFYMVSLEWSGVDRPVTFGVEVHRKHLTRLIAAILDGKAYPFVEVRKDNAGQTFVHTEMNLMGKYMESGLKRLGY
jgi:hypothetical protein